MGASDDSMMYILDVTTYKTATFLNYPTGSLILYILCSMKRRFLRGTGARRVDTCPGKKSATLAVE